MCVCVCIHTRKSESTYENLTSRRNKLSFISTIRFKEVTFHASKAILNKTQEEGYPAVFSMMLIPQGNNEASTQILSILFNHLVKVCICNLWMFRLYFFCNQKEKLLLKLFIVSQIKWIHRKTTISNLCIQEMQNCNCSRRVLHVKIT